MNLHWKSRHAARRGKILNLQTWNKFLKLKKKFKRIVNELSESMPQLRNVQQKFADSRAEASYIVETPVVFNTALDDITIDDDIKLILTADNPGKREQAADNKRYLVGPSGKIARKFFIDNPSLGIDFLKNVIILNKTPIHSPRTVELRAILNDDYKIYFEKSQTDMAILLLEFQDALECPVWITGYSEMRKNGLFEVYTDKLKKLYMERNHQYKNTFVFRHFSMNQFTIDLKQQSLENETAAKTLKRIGSAYRKKIFGI